MEEAQKKVEELVEKKDEAVSEDRSAYNCSACKGEGIVDNVICPVCKGTGKV